MFIMVVVYPPAGVNIIDVGVMESMDVCYFYFYFETPRIYTIIYIHGYIYNGYNNKNSRHSAIIIKINRCY